MQPLDNFRGLTLLSMIVTLFILSAIALSAVSFTGNADDQLRYEDTRTRLGEIRRAITGERNAVYGGAMRLSGFVVENGLLPVTLQNLLQKTVGFDDFGNKTPIFDPIPDSVTGINDGNAGGAEIPLDAPSEILLKGYRPYLHRPVGGTGYFDGWGNRGPVPNDGWLISTSTAHFQSESLGSDGMVGGSNYAQDMPDNVIQNDWGHTLDGWEVTLTNQSGADITPPLRVSLLVYMNDADSATSFNWRRITSNAITGVIPNGASVTATFATTTPATFIPTGEHLLIVVRDPDGNPHTGDDTPYLNGGTSRASERVLFFPMTTRPVVGVILR